MTEDVEDDEQTLDEQEDAEEDVDHDKEIADLEKEGIVISSKLLVLNECCCQRTLSSTMNMVVSNHDL